MKLNTVDILGIQVACVDLDGLLSQVFEWTSGADRRRVCYVNAHVINQACEDNALHRALRTADLVYADGISVVWASRILGGCRLHKMTGADWIDDYCQFAERKGIRTYILAGKPGIARAARENLQNKYPSLKIVGVSDGYFYEHNEGELFDKINQAKPHVLFVGMGTPAQEIWIDDHRADIEAPLCWAVGALFDYVAQVEPRVPGWMNALALEWLWRLIVDPAGKWQRYLLGNPRFVYRVIKERLQREK